MKALSPLIEAVLIVSLTITIAFIIFNWGIKLVREQGEITANKTATETECRFGAITIQNLYYCSGLSGEIRNNGNTKLSRISLVVNYDNGSISQFPLCFSDKLIVCSNNEYNLTLNVNDVYTFNFSQVSSNIKFVYISTACPNIYDRVDSNFINFC